MRKSIIIAVLMMFGIGSVGAVMADTTFNNGGGGSGMQNPRNLDQIKQRIEQRIQEHITKMQTSLTCVENAQDMQSLRSCLPKRGMRRHRGMGMQGGNQ